jgi:hypothetical protein
MAGEVYLVVFRFRSNFEKPPNKEEVETYIRKYVELMQGIGQVTDVEVVNLEQVPDAPPVTEKITIPAPPLPSGSAPEIIIEEPGTGKKIKLPGTGT